MFEKCYTLLNGSLNHEYLIITLRIRSVFFIIISDHPWIEPAFGMEAGTVDIRLLVPTYLVLK